MLLIRPLNIHCSDKFKFTNTNLGQIHRKFGNLKLPFYAKRICMLELDFKKIYNLNVEPSSYFKHNTLLILPSPTTNQQIKCHNQIVYVYVWDKDLNKKRSVTVTELESKPTIETFFLWTIIKGWMMYNKRKN